MKRHLVTAILRAVVLVPAIAIVLCGCRGKKVEVPNNNAVLDALYGTEILIGDQTVVLSEDNISDFTVIEAYDTGRGDGLGALVKFTCTAGTEPVEISGSVMYKMAAGKATEVTSTELSSGPPPPPPEDNPDMAGAGDTPAQ